MRKPASLGKTLVTVACGLGLAASQPAFGQEYTDYNVLIEQAARYQQQGQLTNAIETAIKALAFAPEASRHTLINNIAAYYVQRGNYFQQQRDNARALADIREAYFYATAGWPEDAPSKPLYQNNRRIIENNLDVYYTNSNLNKNLPNFHLEQAKALRRQGELRQAAAEYDLAAKITTASASHTAEALNGLGDTLTVLGNPEKAATIYRNLVAFVDRHPEARGAIAADEVYTRLAAAETKRGNLQAASDALAGALAANPNHPTAMTMIENLWREQLKADPRNAIAHANLALAYQKAGRLNEAAEQYAAAELFAGQDAATPVSVKKMIRLNRGTLFQQQGKYELALQAYESVLSVDAADMDAQRYRASVLMAMKRPEAAIESYLRLIYMKPGDDSLLADALAAINTMPEEQKAAARVRLADALPNNAKLQASVGEAFHAANNLPEAVKFYQRALAKDASMAGTWANLSVAYQSQGRNAEANEALARAKALDPNNQAVTQLVAAASEQKQAAAWQAILDAQRASRYAEVASKVQVYLAAYPNAEATQRAQALVLKGAAHQLQNQNQSAIDAYRQALAITPLDADTRYNLAVALQATGKADEARSEYQKALQGSQDEDLRGRIQEALAAMDEQSLIAKLNEGIAQYEAQKLDAALAMLNPLAAKNVQAQYYVGLIHQDKGNQAGAITAFRGVTQRQPEFAEAHYSLAILLDDQKQAAEATQHFRQYLDLAQRQPGTDPAILNYVRQRLGTAAK